MMNALENTFYRKSIRRAVKLFRIATSARNVRRMSRGLCHGYPSQPGPPPYPVRSPRKSPCVKDHLDLRLLLHLQRPVSQQHRYRQDHGHLEKYRDPLWSHSGRKGYSYLPLRLPGYDQIERRIHELSLILQFKTKTRDFLKTLLWMEDVQTGKIKLFPSRFAGGKEIQDIFNVFERSQKKS